MSTDSIAKRITNAVQNPEEEYGRLAKTVRGAVALSRLSRKQLSQDRASMMAAALTYRTFFSLVPLLVLSLVVIKAFFGPEAIRDALTRFMQYSGLSELDKATITADGAAEGGESIGDWIERFVNNASEYIEEINYGAITIAGIGLFIYAALSLFMMVEQSFNTVYRARASRDLMKRFLSYWGLLTLGFFPLMMSIGFIEWLKQAAQDLPGWLAWVSWLVSHAASAALTWLIFIAIYKVVPNTRVHLRPAIIGAGVAAVLWEVAKAGLSAFVASVLSKQAAVYGSLAMIPVFMLWVYVTWMIVLFGLQIARLVQTIGTEGALRYAASMDGGPQFVSPASAVVLMRDIGAQYASGETADTEGVSERCALPEHVVARMLDALEDAGLVRAVSPAEDEAPTYVPSRPLDSVRTHDVLAAVERLYESPRSMLEDRRLRGPKADEALSSPTDPTEEAAEGACE